MSIPSASRLALLVFIWACAHPPSHAMRRIAAEHEVRTAERQRFEAMMKQDVAALDTLLDEDLSYVHTDGEMQSKAEFIDLIRTRRLVYESIEPSDMHVRVYEGIAIVTGRSQMRVRSASGVSSFGIRFTEAHVHREGRWLLTAWQATRVSP
jgi:ketosteroid isomerase-like protein